MLEEKLAKRLGAWLILLSLGLRLWDPLTELVKNTQVQEFLIYLETGRKVRFSPSLEEKSNLVGESAPPLTLYQQPLPAFTAQDAAGVKLTNMSGKRPNLEDLLAYPLDWDLQSGQPTVLILHTHTTESYLKSGESYAETAAYRTLSEGHNMLSIGERVADILSRQGISVIHDRELHDYPSYNGSYASAREAIEDILAEESGICLILDLHRDAAAVDGGQLDTSAQIDGRESAQLMLVVGTDAGGLYHPRWQENLSLALKLQVLLEKENSGLCRPINLCAERFNGDESPGALLVEVGAAGNTHREALLAARALADGIIALAYGANLSEEPAH